MKTLQLNIDIPSDRRLTIQLPEDFEPGQHQLLLVFQPNEESERGLAKPTLQDLAGKVTSFAGIDAVSWQKQVREEWNED